MATRNLNSEIYVQFTDPDTRENINSGEEIKTIMGKIHKQFEDMNTVAYSGSYSDLSDTPVIDSALSSTSTNAVENKAVKTELDAKAIGATILRTEDLDTIMPSVATFYYAVGSNSCVNNPGGTGKAFGLIAYKSASGYVTQELITQAGVKMYRFYNASTWSAWKTISDSTHTHDYLPLTGGTVTGTLKLSRSQDISGSTTNEGALVIGPDTAEHMLLDGNEIMVKNSSGDCATININLDGGNVVLGCSGYNVTCKGTLAAQSASTSTAGLVKVDGTTIKISSDVISGVGIAKAGDSFSKTYTIGYDDSTVEISGTVGRACEIFNSASNVVGSGTYAHAEGYLTTASGNNAHAEGNQTVATNSGAHAEGYMTTATGTQAHAEGSRTLSSGNQTHAEGYKTLAQGSYTHAEGSLSIASGDSSHVEGFSCSCSSSVAIGAHLEGCENSLSGAIGDGCHIEGYKNTVTDAGGAADAIHLGGMYSSTTRRASFVHGIGLKVDGSTGLEGITVIGRGNNNDLSDSTTANAIFVVGNGSTTDTTSWADDTITRSNAMVVCSDRINLYQPTYMMNTMFRVIRTSGTPGISLFNGTSAAASIYCNGTNAYLGSSTNKFYSAYITNIYGTVQGTADYAEYMEWSDGNTDNEDRRGLLVTYDTDVTDNSKELKIRLANEDDDVIGIVSAAPVVLGDSYDNEWHDKYEKDIFGAIVCDEIEHEDAEEDDKIEYRPRISENYDPTKKYIGRNKRPEWSPIGLLGKLVCIDDGSCVIGKYVTASNGIATLSSEKTNMRMIQRIDETHIKVLLK